MQITDKDLNKLEKLAALKVPEEKREEFKKELEKIVNFVDVLNELDLEGIEATVSTMGGTTPLREDTPQPSSVAEFVLKYAPKSDGKSFEVPKIIE